MKRHGQEHHEPPLAGVSDGAVIPYSSEMVSPLGAKCWPGCTERRQREWHHSVGVCPRAGGGGGRSRSPPGREKQGPYLEEDLPTPSQCPDPDLQLSWLD